MKRDNAVVFLGSGMDACALWRLWLPQYNFPGSSFFLFRDKPDFSVIAGNDICVVQRLCTQQQWEFLQVVKSLGLKIIYDLDDDMWNVPEKNPAYNALMFYKKGFIECMKACDAITVSTRHLAKVVTKQIEKAQRDLKNECEQALFQGKIDQEKYNLMAARYLRHIPVFVVENRLDEKIFAPPTLKKRDKLTVGWAGSSSHIGDLEIVLEGLKEVAEEEPGVDFQFRGLEPPVALRTLPNVVFKLWTPVSEFVSRMPNWNWDIALAPLEDHAFNESKSSIKILESAHCRVPTLVSWVAQYDRFCSYDPELRWLLCAGRNQWAPKIRELIHDEARRVDLGERAYQVMRKYYSYIGEHEQWRAVFQAVTGTQPLGRAL
jgi:glycosyltransferase involved in cell wall biosynthesis